jgi:hypothetical protein
LRNELHSLLIDSFQVAEEALETLKFDKSNEVHRVLVSLYASMLELAQSAIVLFEAKSHTGIDILLRSVVEAFVDIANLANTPAYIGVMQAEYHREWLKLAKGGIDTDNPYLAYFRDNPAAVAKLKDHESALRAISAKTPPRSKLEKFQAAGMEYEYRSIYNSLCNDSHNNLRALTARHFRKITEDEFEIVVFAQPNENDIIVSLDTLTLFLMRGYEVIMGYSEFECDRNPRFDELVAAREHLLMRLSQQ